MQIWSRAREAEVASLPFPAPAGLASRSERAAEPVTDDARAHHESEPAGHANDSEPDDHANLDEHADSSAGGAARSGTDDV